MAVVPWAGYHCSHPTAKFVRVLVFKLDRSRVEIRGNQDKEANGEAEQHQPNTRISTPA